MAFMDINWAFVCIGCNCHFIVSQNNPGRITFRPSIYGQRFLYGNLLRMGHEILFLVNSFLLMVMNK